MSANVNIPKAEVYSRSGISPVPSKTSADRHGGSPEPARVNDIFLIFNMLLLAGLLGFGLYLVLEYLF